MSQSACAASVVVPAFNARQEIGSLLKSLRDQDLREPFQIVVVASGEDGCAEFLRKRHPSVCVIHSPQRVLPGPARNIGVRAAEGEIVAFASADTRASVSWLSQRLAQHRAGFDLVGGSILNGTPRSWVGTAGYLLEYSALLPIESLLREQAVPHALSFRRSVFATVGLYPEDTITGEDTIFNERCLAAGLSVGFAAGAGLYHQNPKRLGDFLSHASAHGRGLGQCIALHQLPAAITSDDATTRARRILGTVHYTATAIRAKYRRIAHYAPRWLPALVVSTPLIAIASIETARSALHELHGARLAQGQD